MNTKYYYEEIATNAGRKCAVSFTTTNGLHCTLIAYVGRARVNYFADIECMAWDSRPVQVTADFLKTVYPEPFSKLKAFAGVRKYKGV